MSTIQELITQLEDSYSLIKKAQINHRKCPKARLTHGYLKVRIQCLDEYWMEFKRAHVDLLKTITKKEDRSKFDYFKTETYDSCEEEYIALKSELQDLLNSVGAAGVTRVNENSCKGDSHGTIDVKLPRIDLPKFSGVYEEWKSFEDTFTSLIHNNKALTDVQRLHYLKSCLFNEASTSLKHFQVTEDNYKPAWEALRKRYSHKRLIVNAILNRLFSPKKIIANLPSQLKSFVDNTNECLQSLQNIEVSTTNWDPVVIFFSMQQLDAETRKEWEDYVSKQYQGELPNLTALMSYLETKIHTLELTTPMTSRQVPARDRTRPFHSMTAAAVNTTAETKAAAAGTETTSKRCCTYCKEDHALSHCKQYGKLNPEQRSVHAKNNRLCYNCLLPGHSVAFCRQQISCKICNRRHHSLLHLGTSNKGDISETQNEMKSSEVSLHTVSDGHNHVAVGAEGVALASHLTQTSTALLATALVPVRNELGSTVVLRALIDQGSQATFISERAAQLLNAKRTRIRGSITGVGSTQTKVSYVTNFELLSRYNENFKVKVTAYIMSTQITSQLPSKHIQPGKWSHIQGLFLADPEFNQPGRIDMLIGIDICTEIIKSEIIRGPPGSPCAQDTQLGWILFGCINEDKTNKEIISLHHHFQVDDMLKQMWELETTEHRKQTAEEQACERIYKEQTTRLNDGRYVVKLPTKTINLRSTEGQTRDIAVKRFNQLERKFEKNPQFKNEYTKVINEYLTLNHMEKVPEREINQPSVYLPHHAVVRDDKETTKVRVVFDASCKGTNNISLNDELMVGPQLQDDLRYLIMRWRMHRICFVADCKQMYRSIFVKESDTNLQRIVWRDNTTQPLQDFRLLRVTFGTASAPYLAVKTLHQVAEDEGTMLSAATKIIKEDFYVDDLMSGAETVEDAIKIANDITMMLNKGGFTLQKWGSNSAKFLKQLEPHQRTINAKVDLKVCGTVKALGLSWDMGEDILKYNFATQLATPEKVTKRNILCEIQKLFDPLGWLGPAIVEAKILMQKLWLQGIHWDEEVDTTCKEEWLNIRENFTSVQNIKISRWLGSTDQRNNISIHGFCDASTKAYAAVAYMRVIEDTGHTRSLIIAAKCRVAPVKPVSLPRLELCGAVLLTRLLKQIKEATRISNQQIHAWTDSKIVLSWIKGDPHRWNVFVSNRVVEILDNFGNQRWNHVASEDNPADVASRGMGMRQLIDYQMWWHGPSWLQNEELPFHHSEAEELEEVNLEKRNVNTKIESNVRVIEKYETFQTLTELQQTLVYAKRFLNSKRRPHDVGTAITTENMEEALKTVIRKVQTEEFEDEIQSIKCGKDIKRASELSSLNPFLDKEGILRVGGRLRHANIPETTKHQIILGKENFLVLLIVADAHKRTLHGGIQLMMCYLRANYWILKVRNLVKACVYRCIVCAKQRAVTRTQMMGDYPAVRVNPARPFLQSGVDFAGPLQLLVSRGKGARLRKGYIAIFICMATKAIHLELVGDLTSAAFIGAFERFVARRGRCSDIWSDQGTNFIGANKELNNLWREASVELPGELTNLLAADGVQWHFNPPHSPNFGGLWEAGVKSVKYHLKRILDKNLTFEEMATVLCQIEACLNSRPLYPIDNSDPDGLDVLTPGHFLIGEAPINVPKPNLSSIPFNRLSHWQHTQRLVQHFWYRWQSEYLNRLQQRPKWQSKNKEFEIGDVVLIKDDALPPGKWSLGRICEKHPGSDGICRVYSLKCRDKIIKRTLSKICEIPINY